MSMTRRAAPRDDFDRGGEQHSQREIAQASRGDTVTVGCKLPNGFKMRLFRFQTRRVTVNGQTWDEEVAEPHTLPGCKPEYVLNGNSVNIGKMAEGVLPEHLIVGGYGLTSGIPREFWEAWSHIDKGGDPKKDGPGADLVRARMIFATSSEESARSQAKDHSAVKSGLEPLDPSDSNRRIGLKSGTIERAPGPGGVGT
jgi:hypothetical protein